MSIIGVARGSRRARLLSRQPDGPTMRDPYQVLGVPKSASDAEIKKAFRKAAKAHHPDQNRNDPKAAQRFAEANQAYEILGDATKRRQFDRGEIDAEGKPKAPQFEGFGFGGARPGDDMFRDFRAGGGPFGGGRGGFDPSDILGQMFGETARRARQTAQAAPRGADVETVVTLTLEDIAAGGGKRMTLGGGRTVDLTIPATVADGQTLRLRGQGEPSPFGGEPGDALVRIRIAPHPVFRAEGRDLHARVSVPLADAVLGGPVRVPTLGGQAELAVPPMTGGGKTMRLKGKGLPGEPPGDLYVSVDIALPAAPDPELEALMRRRRAG
jgi:DnaJ-class molecular chaperone